VEASPHLRKQQAQLLSGTEEMKETDIGWTAPCKHIPGYNITWCEDIRFVPKGMPPFQSYNHKNVTKSEVEETSTPFILAHEFFDALPIHVFQNKANSKIPSSSTTLTPTGPIKPKTGPQVPKNHWHELLVAPSPAADPTSTTKDPTPEFHLTVSKTPTPHSLYLPQMSKRYKALEKTDDAIIEISPESLSYISDFAVRIGGDNPPSDTTTTATTAAKPSTTYTPTASTKNDPFLKPTPSGAALILDYGPASSIPVNTLRGIRSHSPCSPFTSPGLVDLSADVDFLALAEAALKASPSVEIHGPVEQSFFLGTMAIKERAENILRGVKDEEIRKRVETGWKRLVDRGPTGMGRIYKAMAIVPWKGEGEAGRRPVGFGGDVVGDGSK
jgi:NADH dehydrogenase [ubiquinone] 1 alpha subcomplex assembly factor 7